MGILFLLKFMINIKELEILEVLFLIIKNIKSPNLLLIFKIEILNI